MRATALYVLLLYVHVFPMILLDAHGLNRGALGLQTGVVFHVMLSVHRVLTCLLCALPLQTLFVKRVQPAEVIKIYTNLVDAIDMGHRTAFALHVLHVLMVPIDQVGALGQPTASALHVLHVLLVLIDLVDALGQLTASALHVLHVQLVLTDPEGALEQPTASALHALHVLLVSTDLVDALGQKTTSALRVLSVVMVFTLTFVEGIVLVHAPDVQTLNKNNSIHPPCQKMFHVLFSGKTLDFNSPLFSPSCQKYFWQNRRVVFKHKPWFFVKYIFFFKN